MRQDYLEHATYREDGVLELECIPGLEIDLSIVWPAGSEANS